MLVVADMSGSSSWNASKTSLDVVFARVSSSVKIVRASADCEMTRSSSKLTKLTWVAHSGTAWLKEGKSMD